MANTLDAKKLVEDFGKVLAEDGTINLDVYVEAYDYLGQLFNLLGTVFSFVHSDVHEKIGILRHHLKTTGDVYSTVQAMMKYEMDNNLTAAKTSPLSGSRTLLRLHRALAFIIQFLGKVESLNPGDGTSGIAREAYGATLANHHTFLVRQMASAAMLTLPYRDPLIVKLFGDASALQDLQEFVRTITPVYDAVDALYTKNDLHRLP
eukprot:scpid76599/ scgid15620/ Glycolipid transfer protein domain-containing protein 1